MMDEIVIFHFGLFFALLQKNQNFKKFKKRLEISLFYTCVPKITIRCTVLEIWCAADRLMDSRTDGLRDRQMDGKSDLSILLNLLQL